MNRITQIACATLLLATAGAPRAAAQEIPRHIVALLEAVPSGVHDRARDLLRAGDAHRFTFRLGAAAKAYRLAAGVQEDAGLLPEEALWKLASVQHARGDRRAAARTLDRLASLAERFGDPDVQALALLEAALLYHDTGQPEAARRSVERLLPLRRSPHLSDASRTQIEERLIR